MEIYGDQIIEQFKTYGVPPVVAAFFEEQGIAVADLDLKTIPAHGVTAVKDLMVYTTGAQVVMAIAAIALGQLPAPLTAPVNDADGDGHDDDNGQFVEGNREAADDDEAVDALDYAGTLIVEGARVVVRSTDAEGGKIEGGGTTGEVESIERRGDRNYISIETDPDPGHTTGNLITIVDTNLEVLDA